MLQRHAALLLLAIATVLWPVLGGSFVYDDVTLVVRNPALQQGDLTALLTSPLFGAEQGYWRPLTSLALWLGNFLGGAVGIHALALCLHATATVTAFALGKRLFGATRPAFWLALLFAVHPVQVESVGWCSAINDPMWGLFALLAVRGALRWRDAGARGAPWLAASWYLCALLSKENAIATALLVLAALKWANQDPAAPRRLAKGTAALGAALFAWWLLRSLVFRDLTAGLLHAPTVPGHDLLQLATAPPELLVRHLALLVWPFPLTPCRSLPAAQPFVSVVLALAGIAAVVGAAVLWRRSSSSQRLGVTFLIVPLLPTLLRWQSLGSYPVADRYLYLPVFGLALLLAPCANSARTRILPYTLAALWGAMSFAQTWVWHDPEHFVANAIAHAPNDPTLLVMAGDLALMRAQNGDAAAFAAATSAYTQAERLAASDHPELLHRALAPARLGLAWCLMIEQQGRRSSRTPAMIAAFQRAVDTDPTSAPAWVGLGVAHGIAGHTDEAERTFRKALELDPDNVEAHANLARLQAR
jgi:protein O-mannosyl-transferase